MIKQLLFACVVGCIGTIYYLQYDPWFKEYVAHHVCDQLQTSFNCTVKHTGVKDLTIASGSITLENVIVIDHNSSDWHWSAQTFRLSFSWVELLLYGTLDLIIHLADFTMESKKDTDLAILPHLHSLLCGPQSSLPVIVKQVSLQRAHIRIYDSNNNTLYTLNGSGKIKKIDNALKAIVHIQNGTGAYEKRTLIHNAYGSIEVDARAIETHPHITVGGSCSLQIPYLDQHNTQCHIAGTWNNDQGSINLKNSDQSFDITARIHNHNTSITARAPLSSVWKLVYNTTQESTINGTCKLHAKGNLKKQYAKGHILLQEVTAADTSIGSLGQCTFEKTKNKWRGTLYGQRKSGITCSGSWQFDQSAGNGSMQIANNTALFITPSSQWCIPAHAGEFICSFDSSAHIDGTFKCSAQHTKLRTTLDTKGSLKSSNGSYTINGTIGKNEYSADLSLFPQAHLTYFTCSDPNNKPLVSLQSDADQQQALTGTVNFNCIREALNVFCSYDLQGEGVFKTNILKNNTGFDVSLQLIDGTIRIPQTYNFINGLCAQFSADIAHRNITMNNMRCQLHKGTLESNHASLYATDDGSIAFACTPIIFNDCLLNIQKDLFATVSGHLLLQQSQYGIPTLKGIVILDQSQLNENIFSHNAQQSLMHNAKNIFTSPTTDMHLDVTLASSNPVRVKTPFLETDAHIRIAVSNTLQNPTITGSIQLQSGELAFPYKPLYISKGSLYFMPNQLYDPMIELEARNTIKKFNVTMHVTGSLKNHHINLNSSPILSEEQIVALLLVGSQEESLNIVMPALIMQNVKQLLFGSEQTRSKIGKYFTGFLKPFKHITLVPSFVDQTGRGGLRGTVEINVHDRLRALIQKNFSLTEDTRFEIEYMLSDDISLRGVRDERRDISGELEMKWKF